MKKAILIIALVVPIGIFIFLKFFGKNEFSIPVYYETGVDNPPGNCKRNYSSSYTVSDSLLSLIGWKGTPTLIVADSSRAIQLGLSRVDGEFKNEIQVIYPDNKIDLDEFYTCDLLLQKPWSLVLLDDQRKVRGYYDLEHRDEADRLIVELKILLKKY
jgi:hypothetical protein